MLKFAIGLVAGAIISIILSFARRQVKAWRYFRKVEKSPGRFDIELELQQLLREENQKIRRDAIAVHPTSQPKMQRFDIDMLSSMYRRQLRKNAGSRKKTNYLNIEPGRRPNNSASWGSD